MWGEGRYCEAVPGRIRVTVKTVVGEEGKVMSGQFSRTELLLGKRGMNRLGAAKVAVFGIGGVGGHVAEALARSGVGSLSLIDKDVVDVTNLNRQIVALHSTMGRDKVDVMRERILDINPACHVEIHKCFYLPETKDTFDFSTYDYIVDAVDTVTAKIQLVQEAKRCRVPVISSMGAGNKMDPSSFLVADLYETSVCPLAKVMRRELKKCGIESLKVVYSKEVPIRQTPAAGERAVTGSNAFVPAAAGLLLASEVIRDLVKG